MNNINKSTGRLPHSFTFLNDQRPEGRKILLLDLVWTTAYRPNNVRGRGSYFDTIRDHEVYRGEFLKRLKSEGWYIVLFTARHKKYQEVTLETMKAKTGGFVPDACAFAMESGDPPVTKRHNLIHGILPELEVARSTYHSIESNRSTRAMLKKEGIQTMTREEYCEGMEESLNITERKIEQFSLDLEQ